MTNRPTEQDNRSVDRLGIATPTYLRTNELTNGSLTLHVDPPVTERARGKGEMEMDKRTPGFCCDRCEKDERE